MADGGFMRYPPAAPTHAATPGDAFVSLTGGHLRDGICATADRGPVRRAVPTHAATPGDVFVSLTEGRLRDV